MGNRAILYHTKRLPLMKRRCRSVPFIDSILNGMGQIMLQENRWTGILILTGICIGNVECGIGTVLATTVGTLTAKLLRFNPKDIQAGLYGFSAGLVGAVLPFLFPEKYLIWFWVIVGAVAASSLQHLFIRKNIRAYTFPFVAVSWVLIFLLSNYYIPTGATESVSLEYATTLPQLSLTVIKGVAQVIFQSSILSGMLFFIAVFISNPLAACFGLLGSIGGTSIALLMGQPADQIYLGLYGFNCVLSSIVFAGGPKSERWLMIPVVLLTVFIHILMNNLKVFNAFGGILTFPFVAAVWTIQYIQKFIRIYRS